MAEPTAYKTCARCGQNAAMYVRACLRCGLPFADPPQTHPALQNVASTSLPASPSRHASEQSALSRLHSPKFTVPGSWIATLFILVVIGLYLALAYRIDRPAVLHQEANDSKSAEQPNSSGFIESVSNVETPTLIITSKVPDSAAATFRDVQTGAPIDVVVQSGETAVHPIAPGEYTYEVISADPNIGRTHGSATFKRYRSYHLYLQRIFEIPGMSGGHHVGDE